jgi:hypothetical protein
MKTIHSHGHQNLDLRITDSTGRTSHEHNAIQFSGSHRPMSCHRPGGPDYGVVVVVVVPVVVPVEVVLPLVVPPVVEPLVVKLVLW